MMREFFIWDDEFLECSQSASLREENSLVIPSNFQWQRADAGGHFATDRWIKKVVSTYGGMGKTVAWLIEPRCLRPENYIYVDENIDKMGVVLTYDKELLDKYPDICRFYPLGGSSIAFNKWGIYPKTRDICMFYSGKDTTEGHKLRKEIVEELGDRIDVYGAGVGRPVDSKFEVLKDYRYCVVVESCFDKGYFSEKLIDPISVGTIPIYCGTDIATMWAGYPIPAFRTLVILNAEIDYWAERYDYLIPDILVIQNRLSQYRIAEDYIFNNYPDLFED